MPTIKPEVEELHLSTFPRERQVLNAFLSGFSVSFGRRMTAANTETSFYILKPEKWVTQAFGLEFEIPMFVFDFDNLQARAFQAIDRILTQAPARNRVDQSVILVVAKQTNLRDWANEYLSINPQPRMYAFFTLNEIEEHQGNNWFVRNRLSEQLFSRDLFDYKLPINEDFLFFGRDRLVSSIVDSLSRSENRGLFGLRKIGKTSVVFKVKRIWEHTRKGIFLYYDCKLPEVRSFSWKDFLNKISYDIISSNSVRYSGATTAILSGLSVLDKFKVALSHLTDGQRVVVVFDEVEYISPIATLNTHWRTEFIDFWQTLWSLQSQNRRISFLIAGVNPFVVEQDLFSGVQNPIFELFTNDYLLGLEEDEVRAMLRFFGKRMGLEFLPDAIRHMTSEYGGHPKLIRTVGSLLHNSLPANKFPRPMTVETSLINKIEQERVFEISNYCQHIVSELKQFYPDEYEMAELLASGDERSFKALSENLAWTAHLRGYGLISITQNARPRFRLAAVAKYLRDQRMKREGSQFARPIVRNKLRQDYVIQRIREYIKDARVLLKLTRDKNVHTIFGSDAVIEAESIAHSPVVNDESSFSEFCRLAYRSFVEGISTQWGSIMSEFENYHPDLFMALNRIRAYRNLQQHVELRSGVSAMIDKFLKTDLGTSGNHLVFSQAV